MDGDLTMKILKKHKGIFISFLFCFILPFFSLAIINQFFLGSKKIFENNYTLCGVNIGGLTISEAEEKLTNHLEAENNKIKLTINYQDKFWFFNESDFNIKSNIHTVLESAYKSNHKNNYFLI